MPSHVVRLVCGCLTNPWTAQAPLNRDQVSVPMPVQLGLADWQPQMHQVHVQVCVSKVRATDLFISLPVSKVKTMLGVSDWNDFEKRIYPAPTEGSAHQSLQSVLLTWNPKLDRSPRSRRQTRDTQFAQMKRIIHDTICRTSVLLIPLIPVYLFLGVCNCLVSQHCHRIGPQLSMPHGGSKTIRNPKRLQPYAFHLESQRSKP